MPEKILVTGAAGFLGSHICYYFGQRGQTIIGVDKFSPALLSTDIYPNLRRFYEVDLPDDNFIPILKEFQPNLLVHCAGSASVPYSMQEPYDDFRQSAGVTAFLSSPPAIWCARLPRQKASSRPAPTSSKSLMSISGRRGGAPSSG